ncbi:Calmodulin-binding protein 60 D [Dichanthelium oligosanthes]|uniref:Calmodulin-binding protein 60 D n=1 Tax=Dichanthelium oligosanthes TaxID=888268 RepID=A0A1E5VPA9_9POAL|nr:Calmodulin-binding protein 60 D [Dichanthelium oligosanthes]
MAEEPVAKRARTMTVSVEDGDAAGDEASSPRSPKLRPAFLVVLFAVRVIVMNPVPASISEIESTIQRIVDCAFNQFHEMVSRLEPNQEHAAANGSNTNIRLCFLNDFKPPIYTDKNITDENNTAIKVAIYEGGNIITSGPLSKVKVEVLVLRGEFCNNGRSDWTEEEFDNHIVQDREEQGLLGSVRLTNGKAELSHIRFKKGTCRRSVIMAARVCKGESISHRVQEAIMMPVVVQDRRNEANEKRYPPSLDDDVFRLEEIARNGPYRRRLQEAEIFTVQDFLKALNKDPNKLREILKMESKNTSWSNLTKHARQCVLDEDTPELKRYKSEDGNVALLFNCVHDLVGAEFDCGYVASGNFNRAQKALVNKWKEHAHDNLEDISSDYVIKGNVPQRISPSTDDAAGPSVPAEGASQGNLEDISSDYVIKGNVPQRISPSTDDAAGPSVPAEGASQDANNEDMIFPPDFVNMNIYQDDGTALLNPQPISLDCDMLGWQQDTATLMNPHRFGVSENYD